MAKYRKPISGPTEADIMYKSHLQCCVCRLKGDHIHHLDGNPSNNDINNLVLLCFLHHELASIKGNIGKKLSVPTILKYRENHYRTIEEERRITTKNINKPLTKSNLTEEKLLEISKNALIIIELEKITERYFDADWNGKSKILGEIQKYCSHTNIRLAQEVFSFLRNAANQARAGMTESIALGIFSSVMDFTPVFGKLKKNDREFIQLGKLAIEIAHAIVYDAFIYLKSLSVARWGLSIVKYISMIAAENKIKELQQSIENFYKESFSNLNRPERKDLQDSRRLLEVFQEHLSVRNLSFPVMPDDLWKALENEKNLNNRK